VPTTPALAAIVGSTTPHVTQRVQHRIWTADDVRSLTAGEPRSSSVEIAAATAAVESRKRRIEQHLADATNRRRAHGPAWSTSTPQL
jgi:hypothetical protein